MVEQPDEAVTGKAVQRDHQTRESPGELGHVEPAITVLKLFIHSRGAPNRSGTAILVADYPQAAALVRDGVASVSGVSPPENIRALFPGDLLALYLRLRAGGDDPGARGVAGHLAERKVPLAIALTQLVAALGG